MAATFGAKIIPFGVVGEDDVSEVSPKMSQFYFIFLQNTQPWQ